MKKRLLSILLVAAMVVAMVPAMVFATSAATTVTDWSADEIVLMTADDFFEFRCQISAKGATAFAGKTVKLGADIDMAGLIFQNRDHFIQGAGFCGVFDGQGHVIKNATIDYTFTGQTSSYGGGLFGCLGADSAEVTLKNFALVNTTIKGGNRVATLYDVVSTNAELLVENVYVEATVTGATSGQVAGGLVGRTHSGGTVTFSNCVFKGSVNNGAGGTFLGWAAAYLDVYGDTIFENCLNLSSGAMVGGGDAGTNTPVITTSIQSSTQAAEVGSGDTAKAWLETNGYTGWYVMPTSAPMPSTIIETFGNKLFAVELMNWSAPIVEISTPELFYIFHSKLATGETKFEDQTVVLTADLDMSAYSLKAYTANNIGFCGVFDGQYHTISNIKFAAAAPAYTGALFGSLNDGEDAVIKNLGVVNETVSVYANAGALCGNILGSLTIENVYLNATVSNLAGSSPVGGFIGRINSNGDATRTQEPKIELKNCVFDGKMTASDYRVSPYVGILEKTAVIESLSFTNCVIDGTFIKGSSEWAGGGKFICTSTYKENNVEYPVPALEKVSYTNCIQYNTYYQGNWPGLEAAGAAAAVCPEWTGIGSGLTAKTPEGFTARNTSYPVPTTLLPFFADSINDARTNEAEDLVTEYYSAQERVADDGTLDVRLIGLANISADDITNQSYKAIGFEVVALRQANGKVWSNIDENGDATFVYDVYTSYLEDGREISVDGSYVYMYALTGIEANKGIVTFAIKTFYVDANGAKTYTDMFVLNYDTAQA